MDEDRQNNVKKGRKGSRRLGEGRKGRGVGDWEKYVKRGSETRKRVTERKIMIY